MERNAYFDNAKLLLIFLVVFGHAIQPFTSESRLIYTLYTWIYTFHMPVFIFLAGFFAKGLGNKQYLIRLFNRLIVPYIIFQIIYTLFYFSIGKENWYMKHLFYPQWSLWFLLSLFCWHILLIIFKRIPPYLSISLAFLIGLLIGYVDQIGHDFSLSRTFVFFPFFLLGYWLNETHIQWLKQNVMKVISVIVMVVMAIFIFYLPNIDIGWFLSSKSYSTLGFESFGGIIRLGVFLTSILMGACILAWIPKQRLSLTSLGERTVYVYLFHGFIIQIIRQYELIKVSDFFDLIGIAILSVMIVMVLTSRFSITILQPLVELKATRLKSYLRDFRESQHY